MAVYYDDVRKTWYCKFRYTDWTGKNRHTTKRGFKRKGDAKAYELDFKRSAAESPDITVKQLCEKYIAVISVRQRESTVYYKKGFYEKYVIPYIGDLALSTLTPAVMTEWQNNLLAKLSDASARVGHAKLSAMLNYAVKMGWLEKNPLSIAGTIGKLKARKTFWTYEEYQRFREAFCTIKSSYRKKESSFFILCFDVLFFSGMRLSEFLGLGANDIDNNIIHVRKAWHANFTSTELKNDTAKRDIVMPPSIMARVHDYIDSLPEKPDSRLFHISERSLRTQLKKGAAAAGLPYITIHGLRHSHVSHLINLGFPIVAISKRVGHVSPNITLSVYSHMYKTDESSISLQLEKVVSQMLVSDNTKAP